MMPVSGPLWIFLRSNSLPEPRKTRKKRGNKRAQELPSRHLPQHKKVLERPNLPKNLFAAISSQTGCPRGGRQCTFQHPQTVGRCLRCGSTKHAVADRDATTTSSSKGKRKMIQEQPSTQGIFIWHPCCQASSQGQSWSTEERTEPA